MARPTIQLPTVTLDNSGGPGVVSVDILDAAQSLIRGTIGPGAMWYAILRNTGSADAYIGTDADIASESPPDSGNATTSVRFLAGTIGAQTPDYDLGRQPSLKFRLQVGAVLEVTPFISPR